MNQDITDILKDLGQHIQRAKPDAVRAVSVSHSELIIEVDSTAVVDLMIFLRDDSACLFKLLMDVTAVDYPSRPARFDVVYNLLSMRHNRRIRVKVPVDEATLVPSVVSVFPTANWFERETWDMYGILFSGHPDLRRILTDYGFDGHPLRKDFPLTGYVEVRYDEEQKRVIYEPVTLPQEFRRFDFLSPWEGAGGLLPGDEKASSHKDKGE